ncbi:MAG: hypothetical protein A2201_00985 [Alicyclobacillus sp. RIFOXYA1_FULL_53_8]|nr:MAG: hypothetical protein A2201_00985 [Alicyclobacillus sp. RIFOXYA1_FULL_53_8]
MDKSLLGVGALTLFGYVFLSIARPSAAAEGLDATAEMVLKAAPWIIVSMFAAGLLAQFISTDMIARWLGRGTGATGVILAAILGSFGTGSRWAVYPLAAGLLSADASPGAIFAFMTTWQLVSIPRLPAEFPFLGSQFTFLRATISLIVAIVGGLLIEWFGHF